MIVKAGLLVETQRAEDVRNLYANLLILPQPCLSTIKENGLHAKVGKLAPKHCKCQYLKPPTKAKATDQTGKEGKE